MKEKKQCYGRRQFLCNFCTLSGAAMVAPELVSCSPSNGSKEKNGLPKVKVIFGLLDDVQVKPDWPNIGYDLRPEMKAVMDSLNAAIADVEFVSAKAAVTEEATTIVTEDNANGDIAGYIVMQMNIGVDIISTVLENTEKPVLYTLMPYGGDGMWVQRTAKHIRAGQKNFEYMPAVDFQYVVKVATAFSKLNGGSTEDVIKAAHEIRLQLTPSACKAQKREDKLTILSPEETLKKMNGMKILSVEYPFSDDYRQKVKEAFGVDIIVVSLDEVNSETGKVDDAKARQLADAWKKGADSIKDASDDTIFNAARLYYAMKDLLKKNGAQAITINCLGGVYTKKLCAYPCLGFMQLQDEGLLGICENDVDSTLTMMAFNIMTGRMGYVSDPVMDAPTRSIIYTHCVSTRKLLGQDGPTLPYEIMSHSEDRDGASVRATVPIGYPLTTLKFNADRKIMAVHTGTVTGNSRDDRACRTKIIAEVNGDYEKLYQQWDEFIWHRVTFFGDFAKEAVALAEKIGYEVRWEC